jgi:DNA-binding winged helix-turn-helix (wHTH) protein
LEVGIVHFVFAPFRLDVPGERLWREGQVVALRPKSFQILSYLVEHAQRLVRKEELLSRLWGDVAVSDAVLKTSLKEIRRALGDSAQRPRFVETAHRLGYRFIALVTNENDTALGARDRSTTRIKSPLIGREAELQCLERAFERARSGQRQVVFVSGEPGIGASSLSRTFLDSGPASGGAWIARARCLDQHGPAEYYMPILEGLGRLCNEECQGERGGPLLEVLEQVAPSWIEQLPSLTTRAVSAPRRRTGGATRWPRLRELAEAFERFTQRHCLVFCVEGLQFADAGTLDLIRYLGQRTDPSSLMLLCTYSTLEGNIDNELRLRNIERDLCERGSAHRLVLPFLGLAEVNEYLAQRFVDHRFPSELGALVLERTSGKPFFVVKLLDHWAERGWLRVSAGHWALARSLNELAPDVPESIVRSIEAEKECLSPFAQRVLEAASVAGVEFSTAAVAAALADGVVRVEEACLQLERNGRFLRTVNPSACPGDSSAHCCAFIHPLHRQVIFERLGISRRLEIERNLAAFERKTPGTGLGFETFLAAQGGAAQRQDVEVVPEPITSGVRKGRIGPGFVPHRSSATVRS